MIVAGEKTFRDSVEIKRTFPKHFPLQKLVNAFTTARGNTHFELSLMEDAEIVLESWKSDYFGGDSVVRKASDKRNEHNALNRGTPSTR